MGSIENPQIAVLINSPLDNATFWLDRKFPDASRYDLIILSGGKADASCSEPWVLGVLEYVRVTSRDFPRTKMLGICWGHQAISRALGGQVRAISTGPIAAIEDIRLTQAGKKFFPFAASSGFYGAPEFHVREVATPAPGFVHLAEHHECFINEANNILTFQAHPGISTTLAKMLLEEDQEHSGNSSTEELEREREIQKLEQPTDGGKLLTRVIEWLKE
ncbi:copper/iron-regulated glutamine amidotransferase [Penicillium capsulatum]|uniref:Copper/iron-regulated glutamine amidotransferase n=1 Tax=Penicillium capsulatum TaxID=69766 RepID=A0A9W9HUG3_9EURO|nr:copper/iron-regulated glutamine amidotransferase [Penicillium capsulatum]KAJ6106619.1 copper/iron-regulated glutamine amidotransferase [Penicillium capsulatum]